MAQAESFSCPTCGASLTTDGNQIEVQCPYCSNMVIVPDKLRIQRNQPEPQVPQMPMIVIQGAAFNPAEALDLAATYPRSRRRSSGCSCAVALLVLIIVATTVLPILFAAGAMTTITASVQQALGTAGIPISLGATEPPVAPGKPTREFDISGIAVNTATPAPTQPLRASPTTSFGGVLLSFGSKGTGAGFFDDARGVAVDGNGNIYVSEYSSGRIQKFDATGRLVKGWIAAGKNPIRGLAADRNANVYAVRDGVILKYNGGTGDLISKIKAGSDYYDDVAVLLDGGPMAVVTSPSDDFVRFNTKGSQISRIKNAVSSQVEATVNPRIAVDGVGNIYAVEGFSSSILKFSADGKFQNKFGGSGDAPGQLHAANGIAVDGQGRVFVSDINGIQMFASDGRFLGRLSLPKLGMVAFGLAVTDKNELLVAARDQILKLKLSE